MNLAREEIIFNNYVRVQHSGVVNMFDRPTVCQLAGISTDEYQYVVNNYDRLSDKYGR